MEAEPLRQTPFHRALHRPHLIMGGERELMLFSMLVAGGLAVSGLNLVTLGIGATLWLICAQVLRRMAKADPQLSAVYLRQLKYRHYYGPFSRPLRVAKDARTY